jgi:putative addiction module killer protein
LSGFEVREYLTENLKSPYREWLDTLDRKTKARIQARILRFELANLGDYKSLGDGIFEARCDFGPGYRIYFGRDGKKIIVLLVGGDKSSQKKDIKKAQQFWADYLEKAGA